MSVKQEVVKEVETQDRLGCTGGAKGMLLGRLLSAAPERQSLPGSAKPQNTSTSSIKKRGGEGSFSQGCKGLALGHRLNLWPAWWVKGSSAALTVVQVETVARIRSLSGDSLCPGVGKKEKKNTKNIVNTMGPVMDECRIDKYRV